MHKIIISRSVEELHILVTKKTQTGINTLWLSY